MFDLQKIVRPSVAALKPYSSARDEFTGMEGIFLDANENPYGELNRYPDPYQRSLKEALAKAHGLAPDHIFVGNGSDEVIDLAFRVFCQPEHDKALTFTPTYGMYQVAADINQVALQTLPLNADFQIDTTSLEGYLTDPALKLIILCSPNNPTGNNFSATAIAYILSRFRGMVLIDEAYAEFSEKASWISRLSEFPNLIVSRTFSKAHGLAAARVGMAYASPQVLGYFNKVKPPYNVSQLNQEAALKALRDKDTFELKVSLILDQRIRLTQELSSFSFVKKVYPSDANFLLVEVGHAQGLYDFLVKQKIIVRNRHKVVANALRITLGRKDENDQLMAALQQYEAAAK